MLKAPGPNGETGTTRNVSIVAAWATLPGSARAARGTVAVEVASVGDAADPPVEIGSKGQEVDLTRDGVIEEMIEICREGKMGVMINGMKGVMVEGMTVEMTGEMTAETIDG
jgi:hypothetical protein